MIENALILAPKKAKFGLNSYVVSDIESAPILASKKAKNLGKHKIFFTWVYIIFKYGKPFRFAPSFNNEYRISLISILLE